MSAAGIGILLALAVLSVVMPIDMPQSPEHGSRAGSGAEKRGGGGRSRVFPAFQSGRRQAAIVHRSPHQRAVRLEWKAAKPQTNRR